MKKYITTLAMLIVLFGNAFAQDTLTDSQFPPANYFSFMYPNRLDVLDCGDVHPWYRSDFTGYYRYVEHTTTIYGMAGAYTLPYDLYDRESTLYDWVSYWEERGMKIDTTRDSSYEYMCIYKADTVPLLLGRLKVENYTTPTYYFDVGMRTYYGNPMKLLQVYERYFDTPIQVCDSFYIGSTNRYRSPFGDGYVFIPFVPRKYIYWSSGLARDSVAVHCYSINGNNPYWTYSVMEEYPLIFPILTPNPDTTSNGDTLSAGEPDLLHRLTSVTPNPATGRAKVVSSFGLTMVEAFNAAGEKVHELRLPDAPLTATLDISRWPTGTYILRLHTPQGIATKKLVVSR